MAVPGGFLNQRAREMRRDFTRAKRWLFVALVAFVAGATVLNMWMTNLLDSPWAPDLWLGAGAVAVVWAVVEALRFDGAANLRLGLVGERDTARALRRFADRTFAVFHDIQLEGRNVDHALVGPRGLIALESKTTRNTWQVTERGVEEFTLTDRTRAMPDLLDSARQAARNLRLLALAVPSRVRTEVVPVLVLWGRISPVPGGAMWVDGVLVGNGSQAREWMPNLLGLPLSDDESDKCRRGLEAYQASYRRAAPGRPMRALSGAGVGAPTA